jgi:uncharacterized protein (TIRG00374 family)
LIATRRGTTNRPTGRVAWFRLPTDGKTGLSVHECCHPSSRTSLQGSPVVTVPEGTPEGEDERRDVPSRRSRWQFLFKVACSVALLAFLLLTSDPSRLWHEIRQASLSWLLAALAVYFLMIVVSAWRWRQLLDAQGTPAPTWYLVKSYLVATFFGNFLPSNIGGDLIRIKDTVPISGSRTLAAAVVLLDRGIGLLALILVAALGTSMLTRTASQHLVISQPILWLAAIGGFGGLLTVVAVPRIIELGLAPLKRFHQEWVEERLRRLVRVFERLRASPGRLVNCLAGAVVVQAILVVFYAVVAASLRIPIPAAHLAILVPLSFLAQLLPISVNGFGVREATFTAYFATLGLPAESALALSLLATATIMAFSLSGVAAYLSRR